MDLIKVGSNDFVIQARSEIEQLKNQIDILDAIFLDFSKDYSSKKKVSYCDSVKNLCNYYYENLLHKLGYSNRKEE